MAYNKEELIEKLEERLKWYYNEATEEEFDAKDIDAICAMLEKLDPISDQFPPADEAYQKLKERIAREEAGAAEGRKAYAGTETAEGEEAYAETESAEGNAVSVASDTEASGYAAMDAGMEEHAADLMDAIGREKKKRKRGIRAAVIICVGVLGVGILLLNCCAEAYADKSLFTMIMEKAGVVKVRMTGENTEDGIDANRDVKKVYDSWSDLDIDIKSKIAVPEYIPEGYDLYNIECSQLYDKTLLLANYYNGKGEHLRFSITSWEEEISLYTERMKEDDGCEFLSEYSDENTFYYHYEDEYICLTSTEYYYYRITGNLSLEEMIKIREGLKDNR